jgi:uncharacterized protein YfeS
MKMSVMAYTHDTINASVSISMLGPYLTSFLSDVEPTALEVEVQSCFRTAPHPRGHLSELHEEFHRDLERLPTVRYQPKTNKLSVRFESRVANAENPLNGDLVLSVFVPALRELSEVLTPLMLKHPRLGKLVGKAALERAFNSALKKVPSTDRKLDAEHQRLRDAEFEARARLTPWERLEVDWSRYHAGARALLDDPFLWERTDDYAPHGNDTGADLLDAFDKWRRRNRGSPCSEFRSQLLRGWGLGAETRSWAEKPLSTWSKKDEMFVTLYFEIDLAIAFAQLKYEAACEKVVRDAALDAIRRELDPQVSAHFGWRIPEERLKRIRQCEAILVNAPLLNA